MAATYATGVLTRAVFQFINTLIKKNETVHYKGARNTQLL